MERRRRPRSQTGLSNRPETLYGILLRPRLRHHPRDHPLPERLHHAHHRRIFRLPGPHDSRGYQFQEQPSGDADAVDADPDAAARVRGGVWKIRGWAVQGAVQAAGVGGRVWDQLYGCAGGAGAGVDRAHVGHCKGFLGVSGDIVV